MSRRSDRHDSDLTSRDLFLDRDLSLLEFQKRVFDEARDESNPLLERVKFLGIVASNIDEFIMVRAPELLEIHELLGQMREYLCKHLIPALSTTGIHVLNYEDLSESERAAVETHFHESILPVLVPIAVDSKRQFPHVPNLSLNLALLLKDGQQNERLAIVRLPPAISQFVPFQKGSGRGFVWLEQVIAANLAVLFPGMEVIEAHPFRAIRKASISFEQLDAVGMLEGVEEGVRRRHYAPVVALAVGERMSPRLADSLAANLGIETRQMQRTGSPVALGRVMELASINRPDLLFPALHARIPAALTASPRNIFSVIREHDILLHHPYESFQPVIDFLRQAADDPKVLAISITLYRVGAHSPIVRALLDARRKGKQVTAVVELKARFDEQHNAGWARTLAKAGAHVVYGAPHMKVHTKFALVVRRENDKMRRYVHLSTGNYNSVTSKIYTDLGLLTCNEAIGADVADVLNYLTGHSSPRPFRRLIVAPFNFREDFAALVRREIAWHERGSRGHLIFKMNGLTDHPMIELLYEAAAAGVRIDLIVRSMCCLRPGIPGVSQDIRVRSIVGRFLEHSRAFYFRNGGHEEVFIGSADLRPRNLDRRVETLFPIEDPALVRRVRNEILDIYLADNVKARELRNDGTYLHTVPVPGDPVVSAQQWFIEH